MTPYSPQGFFVGQRVYDVDELSLQARSRFIIGCTSSVGVSSLGAGQRVTCSLPAVSGWHWLSRWLYRRVPRHYHPFSFGRGEMLTIATMAISSRLLPIPSAYSDPLFYSHLLFYKIRSRIYLPAASAWHWLSSWLHYYADDSPRPFYSSKEGFRRPWQVWGMFHEPLQAERGFSPSLPILLNQCWITTN